MSDALSWLQRRFHRDFSQWGMRLCLDLRAGHLRYRIAGFPERLLRLPSGDYVEAGGFAYNTYLRDVSVEDWDHADTDWVSGTVGSIVTDENNKRERLVIKIHWPSLERWGASLKGSPDSMAPLGEQAVRSDAADLLRALAAKKEAPASVISGPRGGRPEKIGADFWIEVALFADLHGLDEQHRRELQAHMESWTAERYSDPPAAGTIRNELSKLYKERARRTKPT